MSFFVEQLSRHRLRCAIELKISAWCRSSSAHLSTIAILSQPTQSCVSHLRQHQGPKDRTDSPHLSQICISNGCGASALRSRPMQRVLMRSDGSWLVHIRTANLSEGIFLGAPLCYL